MSHNHNKNDNSTLLPDSQSNTVLQQFHLKMEELKYFTKQVSNYITKMTQAHSTTQEHTGKLTEHAISKALVKTQDTIAPLPNIINASNRNIIYASPTSDSHEMLTWPPNQQAVLFTPHADSHQTYNCQEAQTNAHSDYIEHQVHQTPLDFNQSVVALLRC